MTLTLKVAYSNWRDYPHTWRIEHTDESYAQITASNQGRDETHQQPLKTVVGYSGPARMIGHGEMRSIIDEHHLPGADPSDLDSVRTDEMTIYFITGQGGVELMECPVEAVTDAHSLGNDVVITINGCETITEFVGDVEQVAVLRRYPHDRAHEAFDDVYPEPLEVHCWMGPERLGDRTLLTADVRGGRVRHMLVETAWLLNGDGRTIERIAP